MKAITINNSKYTVRGTVVNKSNNIGIPNLQVFLYDKDLFFDDFIGIAVSEVNGIFSITFDADNFVSTLEWKPDLYFVVQDAGLKLLNTKNNPINNANETTPGIKLVVDIVNDKLRKLINPSPVSGWKGGFVDENPKFAYPNPDLSLLVMEKNRTNIDKIERQQKVVWPEFSWESKPESTDSKRCYQMFAPDISRLGYTKEGKIYSIICPQQGVCSSVLGCLNVEVTVTGNRGWVDESNMELAADMSVEGRIWFSPSANETTNVMKLADHFKKLDLPFPSNKANAIIVTTHLPGQPDQPIFPLRKGSSTEFPIPEYAKHESVAWSLAHLAVEIGPIKSTGVKIVDKFNQFVLDIFNTASGNMLLNGNILTWNVWFTAPENVNQKEWTEHTELWRKSIDADHGNPDGPGTEARYFDGTRFEPIKELVEAEAPKLIAFIKEHLI